MLSDHIKLIGLDPSLRNWGIAEAWYDTKKSTISVEEINTINPVLSKSKQVRQNSLDLETARQLYTETLLAIKGATAIFVEVPVGSQSARAMASYGVCVGVLGALRAAGHPLIEVTPAEVKLAGFGKATSTKQQMIEWAMNKHPEANWPTYQEKGKTKVTLSKAEHQADAIAAIYAGLSCNTFKQLLSLLNQPT